MGRQIFRWYLEAVFKKFVSGQKGVVRKVIGFMCFIFVTVVSVILYPILRLFIKAPKDGDARSEYIYPMF